MGSRGRLQNRKTRRQMGREWNAIALWTLNMEMDVASTRTRTRTTSPSMRPPPPIWRPFSSLVDRPKAKRSKSFTAPPSHSSFVPRLLRSAAPVPKDEATKGGEAWRGCVGKVAGKILCSPKIAARHSGAPIIASLLSHGFLVD